MKNKHVIAILAIITLMVLAIPSVHAQTQLQTKATIRATQTQTFTGSLSAGHDSTQHTFSVPSNAEKVEVKLQMPSGADFDLSVWDDQGRRTGGWTSSDHSTKTNIPSSSYSGYSANPEWVKVDPPQTSGTWKTGAYAYSGSGTYTITVTITVPDADTTPPTVSITSPDDGATVTTSDVTVTWTGSDSGTGIDHYEVRIDSGSWTNVGTSTSHTFTGLSDGSHTVDVKAYDGAGNTNTDSVTFTVDTSSGGGTEPQTYTFTGSLSAGHDSTQHTFNVPDNTAKVEVKLQIPSGADFDLSVWDDQGRRTGGWTSSDHSTKTNIPSSSYSGYSANPEWVNVEPPQTSGTWKTGAYAYSGSGTYTITVTVTPQSGGGGGGGGGTGDGVVNKYAVIVGISDYKAINDLSYCDEDATDWYNFLHGTLGWSADHITVLGDTHSGNYPKYDGIATEHNVKQAIQNMVNTADADDIIAYISSGHGSGDGSGSSLLCMWDMSSGEDGEDGSLYDTELATLLKNAVADKIFVFLDHCYSGGFGDDLMNMPNKQHVYLTTTCTANGYGYDDSTHHNGAWTYYFLEYSWINHYSGSDSTALETIFSYAHSAYPHSGGDEPQQFDGDTSSYFYLH